MGAAVAIDTVAVIKTFADSISIWANDAGRSNNPPQSVAQRIGASPRYRIYSETGGNEPQTLLLEFFADLSAGRRDLVLLTGAEAIRNQRSAQRSGQTLNWEEHHDEPLEDRGFGKFVANDQEVNNGMVMPVYYYQLIEQARRLRLGKDRSSYLADVARMLAAFSQVAAENPCSQFPLPLGEAEILAAEPITDLYTKRMIAQDSVNQGAALLLTTVGKARELGIDPGRCVYLHGAAQGIEVDLSLRPDPSCSEMASRVVDATLSMAGLQVGDVDLFDIYSCFPCAVTAVSDHLGIEASAALTLTGGLPYFGGPGNNYATHALAQMWSDLTAGKGKTALVHAKGGVLSKHAAGVYSTRPGGIDWSSAETVIDTGVLARKTQTAAPTTGTIISYSVNYLGGEPVQAIALCDTDDDRRFICSTDPEDMTTVAAMLADEPAGRRVMVRPHPAKEHTLHFQFAAGT
jgi:acetyl-CoA C-acetyltransferase